MKPWWKIKEEHTRNQNSYQAGEVSVFKLNKVFWRKTTFKGMHILEPTENELQKAIDRAEKEGYEALYVYE